MIYNRKLRIFKFILMAIAFVAVFSMITMLLWNWLIPDIFRGPTITYLQSVGLIVLSQILLRGFGRSVRHSHWRGHEHWRKRMQERWEKLTPEEREQWKEKCGHWRWEDWDKDKTEKTEQDKSV